MIRCPKDVFEITLWIDSGHDFLECRLTATENGLSFVQSFSVCDSEVFDADRALEFYKLFRVPFSDCLMRSVRNRHLILLASAHYDSRPWN